MYRALATANEFARFGWRVTVLTATRDTFERITGSDPESERHIDARITIVRVPFEPARGEADLRKWSRFRLYSPLLWNYVQWLWSQAPFPEIGYGGWKSALLKATDEIHREHPVDLVVGSANPNVDFAPGRYLHRKHRTPYVMDYRDTWHLDMYSGKTLGRRWSRSRRLEKKLLNRAAEAWFVNQPILDWHAAMYPENSAQFQVVANGFDPHFLHGIRERPVSADDGLTFGYLGTIYGPMPLRETLEGWRRARSRSALISRSRLVFRGRLGHYAEADTATAAQLYEFQDDAVAYLGPVSKTQVSEAYNDFDALVLILGHSQYVTSGKVFEYAATGLPIASLHHPETAATAALEGYPRHFQVPEPTPEFIAETFIATAAATVAQQPTDRECAQRWSARFSREQQLRPRVDALWSLVSTNHRKLS